MANANRVVGQWRLPAILSLAYAVSMADRSLVAVAGGPIKDSFALNDFQFGLLSGPAFAVLFCLCGVPLGWLADRADSRAMIVAGLVSWSAMTAFCGLAHSYGELVLARIGVGLGEACLLPAGMAWLKSQVPPAQMGRSVAIFLMGSAVGAGFAHLAGGYFLLQLQGSGSAVLRISNYDAWRALFLFAGLLGLGVAATMWLAPRSTPAHAAAPQVCAVARHLWDERRAYVPLTAAICCTLALSQATAAWLPLYYTREYGLKPGQSALSIGVLLLASAPLGQALGGWSIDTCRSRGVAAPANFVLALCTALAIVPAVTFCASGSIRFSQAAYLVFGVISAAATPCGLAGWQSLAPTACTGQVVAVLVAVVTLVGLGGGPLLIGILTQDIFGDEHALGRAIMALCLVTSSLSCLFALAGRAAFKDSLDRRSKYRATQAPA